MTRNIGTAEMDALQAVRNAHTWLHEDDAPTDEMQIAAYLDDRCGFGAATEADVRAQIDYGQQLLDEGYHLKETARSTVWDQFDIPENAIKYRIVDAGHIATSLAKCAQYVIKIS